MPILPNRQITMLASYSMPGPRYVFPPAPSPIVLFSGIAAIQLLWSTQLVGILPINTGGIDMAKQFCQQNDIGVKLVYQFLDQNNLPINLSGATDLVMRIGYPDSTPLNIHSLDRVGTILTDGSDGMIYYITVGGDLFMVGDYEIQGKFTSAGKTYSGQTQNLEVLRNTDNN